MYTSLSLLLLLLHSQQSCLFLGAKVGKGLNCERVSCQSWIKVCSGSCMVQTASRLEDGSGEGLGADWYGPGMDKRQEPLLLLLLLKSHFLWSGKRECKRLLLLLLLGFPALGQVIY